MATIRRILCYGDSNTWGKSPVDGQRYPESIRWPSVLQTLLPETEVIEEGLGSRTIHEDDPDPDKPGRNGYYSLSPVLQTHNPIDWLIIYLGTNDTKSLYRKSAEAIAQSLEEYAPIISHTAVNDQGQPPKVLLLAPPVLKEAAVKKDYWVGAEAKTRALGPLLKEVAGKFGWLFLNLADYVEVSLDDGVHLTPPAHRQVAEIVAETIRTTA